MSIDELENDRTIPFWNALYSIAIDRFCLDIEFALSEAAEMIQSSHPLGAVAIINKSLNVGHSNFNKKRKEEFKEHFQSLPGKWYQDFKNKEFESLGDTFPTLSESEKSSVINEWNDFKKNKLLEFASNGQRHLAISILEQICSTEEEFENEVIQCVENDSRINQDEKVSKLLRCKQNLNDSNFIKKYNLAIKPKGTNQRSQKKLPPTYVLSWIFAQISHNQNIETDPQRKIKLEYLFKDISNKYPEIICETIDNSPKQPSKDTIKEWYYHMKKYYLIALSNNTIIEILKSHIEST